MRFGLADYRLSRVTRPCFLSPRHAGVVCVGALLLAAACKATYLPATGDIATDLEHRDPRVRLQAAEQAVSQGRTDLLPDLVDALEDRDPAVRMFASVALRKLTGKDFGFKPHGSPAERQEAVRQWRVWIARDQTPRDVAPSPDEPEPAEPDGDEAEQTATARRADG